MGKELLQVEAGLSARIRSIDFLRGFVILVMIFVNDLAGVGNGVPAWMKHMADVVENGDGMTFVDVVFPAFLFLVGMSIPFAIGRKMDKGVPGWKIWQHILTRTVSLLIIGFFMVNADTIADPGILNPGLWITLMYLGVILIWNIWPKSMKPWLSIGLRVFGGLLLIAMFFVYRGNEAKGLVQMQTQWWGIIGLIGWAYLVACTVYYFFRRQPVAMLGAVAILYLVFFADQTGFFGFLGPFQSIVGIGGDLGSQGALAVSGAILGMILTPDSPIKTHWHRIRWAFLYGLGMAIAAILLHSLNHVNQMFIINKNMATPPWCLWSAAITTWLWIVMYWLVDIRGWTKWGFIIEPAGQNALFAYILAPLLTDGLFEAGCRLFKVDNFYWNMVSTFGPGMVRAVVFAFFIAWLAGALKKAGMQLKL